MTRARDEAQVAEAGRLHRLGLTTRAIAAQLPGHPDPRTVQRWLDEIARPRGPRKRADVRDETILELKNEGLSFQQIALRVRMSKTGVRLRYGALTGKPRPDRPKNTETSGEPNA